MIVYEERALEPFPLFLPHTYSFVTSLVVYTFIRCRAVLARDGDPAANSMYIVRKSALPHHRVVANAGMRLVEVWL